MGEIAEIDHVHPLHSGPARSLSVLVPYFRLHLYQGKKPRRPPDRLREQIPVMFSLKAPEAHSVQVIGSSTTGSHSLAWCKRTTAGPVDLQLAAFPRPIEYAFLVDGKIVPILTPEFYQDDGFGKQNTVLAWEKKTMKPSKIFILCMLALSATLFGRPKPSPRAVGGGACRMPSRRRGGPAFRMRP